MACCPLGECGAVDPNKSAGGSCRFAKEFDLLQEQLESQLIMLRRGEPAIHQVVEPDDEPTGVGTQGGADDGTREPTNKCAKDEWSDARADGLLDGRNFRIT